MLRCFIKIKNSLKIDFYADKYRTIKYRLNIEQKPPQTFEI